MKNKILYFFLIFFASHSSSLLSNLKKSPKKGTNEEINESLKEKAIQSPFLILESRKNEKNEQFLYSVKGRRVKEVTINILGSQKFPQLPSLRAKYINATDHDQLRNSFLEDIRNILEKHGYTNPYIKLETKENKANTHYHAHVKRGPVCLISSVETSFKNNTGIDLRIKKGDPCSTHTINERIKDFISQLKKNGYQRSIITLKEINFNQDRKKGHVVISGQLGEALSYKVVESKRTGFLDKFLWFKIRKHPLDDIKGKYTTDLSISHQIKEFYSNRGYYEVEVLSPVKSIQKNGKALIVYKVNPGPFYTIGSISIVGNQSFSQSKILKVKKNNYGNFSKKRYYSPKEMDEFIETLYSFYYEHGYWNVKIQKIEKVNKETSSIDITLRIREEKKHILHTLRIKGNKKFSESKLNPLLKLQKGAPLNPESIGKNQKKLQEFYKYNSFFDVQINTEFSQKSSTPSVERVNLTFHIKEGRPYRIKKISISGNEITKLSLVKSYLDFKEGHLYSLSAIESSRRRLLDLGIFNSVNFSRRDLKSFDSEEQGVEIHIELKESNRGNISFGPGFDLRSGFLYHTDLFYKNPFGRGHKFLLSTAISEEKDQPYITSPDDTSLKSFQLGTSIGITHNNPFFFHRNVQQNLSIFYKRGTFSDESSNLWVSTVDLKLQFDWDLSFFLKNSKIFFYYQFLKSKEEGISRNRTPLLSIPDSTYSIFGLGFALDYRDSSSLPKRGSYFEGKIDLSSQFPYGDFFYLKNKILFSYYLQLYRNFVLALHYSDESYNLVRRVAKENSGNFLPRAQRLFINSSEKVRGFKEDLGPYSLSSGNKPKRKALGGTNSIVYKAEFRIYQIYSIFGITFFLDGGNTFFPEEQSKSIHEYYSNLNSSSNTQYTAEDLTIRPRLYQALSDPGYFFGNMYHSIGTSINLALPMGVLNLSLAYPIAEPRNSTWRRVNQENPLQNLKLDLNIGTYF